MDSEPTVRFNATIEPIPEETAPAAGNLPPVTVRPTACAGPSQPGTCATRRSAMPMAISARCLAATQQNATCSKGAQRVLQGYSEVLKGYTQITPTIILPHYPTVP